MKPLTAVERAQSHMRSAARLLEQGKDVAPTPRVAAELRAASLDLLARERSLDLVLYTLRDLADPTRGVR